MCVHHTVASSPSTRPLLLQMFVEQFCSIFFYLSVVKLVVGLTHAAERFLYSGATYW